MSAKVSGSFQSLLDQVTRLRIYGANAVYRRIRALIAEFARAEAEGRLSAIDLNPTRRPCNGHGPGPWEPLSFEQVVDEVQQDDARRTVFLDPSEATIAALADFLSRRLQTLEFRDPEKKLPLQELETKARALLVGKVPLVSVNPHMGTSLQEVVHTLRYLADLFEKTAERNLAAHTYQYSGNAATLAGECSFESKEQIGSRWSNNGTVLEYRFRDVYKCVTHDPCCGNPSYHYEYQNDHWEVVWKDSGNSTTPPPVNPPNYQSSPWNNRLPVFTDSTIGTLTSDYGWRTVNGSADFHAGIDIAAGAGSNVQANVSGTVVWINPGSNPAEPQERGIIVRDANNITHTYWHVTAGGTLQVNDPVSVGDRLGSLYDWGTRTHLHYAEHAPPNGDWKQRNNTNSRDPLP